MSMSFSSAHTIWLIKKNESKIINKINLLTLIQKHSSFIILISKLINTVSYSINIYLWILVFVPSAPFLLIYIISRYPLGNNKMLSDFQYKGLTTYKLRMLECLRHKKKYPDLYLCKSKLYFRLIFSDIDLI